MNDMDKAIVELKKAMIQNGDIKDDNNNNSVASSGRAYKGHFENRSGLSHDEFKMRKSAGKYHWK